MNKTSLTFREDYMQVLPHEALLRVASNLGCRGSGTQRQSSRELIQAILDTGACDEDILAHLKVKELRSICVQFLLGTARARDELYDRVLDALHFAQFAENLDISFDECEEDTWQWAQRYLHHARKAGVEADFEFFDNMEPDPDPVGATIRMITSLVPYGPACDQFLDWQEYGGPRNSDQWFKLTFSEPWQWRNALCYLKAPWDFIFSRLLMPHDNEQVIFDVTPHNRKSFTKKEQQDFAAAILDGVLYDNDHHEYIISCSNGRNCLSVEIEPSWQFKDRGETWEGFEEEPQRIRW